METTVGIPIAFLELRLGWFVLHADVFPIRSNPEREV